MATAMRAPEINETARARPGVSVFPMIFRHDQITVDLPAPNGPDANAAAAVQELLGGKFGEMSTLMNYTFQSFNFRGKKNFRPFYDLISNIAAEEYSHIEAVAATINLLLKGSHPPRRPQRRAPRPAARLQRPRQATHKDAKKNPAPLKEAVQHPQHRPFPQQRPDRRCRRTPWAASGPGKTCSPVATSSSTCCTTSSWNAARAPGKVARVRVHGRPLRPRDDRLPARARRHAYRCLREGVGSAHRRERLRAPAHSRT